MDKALKVISIILLAVGAIVVIAALIALYLRIPLATQIAVGDTIFKPNFSDVAGIGLALAFAGALADMLTDKSPVH